jgi:hypothetical protein
VTRCKIVTLGLASISFNSNTSILYTPIFCSKKKKQTKDPKMGLFAHKLGFALCCQKKSEKLDFSIILK